MWDLVKMFALFTLLTGATSEGATDSWWKTASIYQIYPRSFKDSDGNGIGDLKGITQQLPYLKEIGIDATWISSLFKSPMADFGYDVEDFYQIDPLFGTLADFKAMLAKAKEIGLKIIMEFVPNHTSVKCEWFVKSAQGDPDYKDFYVWNKGKILGNGARVPPTNWIGIYGGSMWTWHDERQAYYLHQYLPEQPELNYYNPKVHEAMKNVLRYWGHMGVDGFHIDSADMLYEVAADANGTLPDERRNEAVKDPSDYRYLQHIYTLDQPPTIGLIYEFRDVLKELDEELGGDERVLITEAYSPNEVLVRYYGNASTDGAQIPMNFALINFPSENSPAKDYASFINDFMVRVPTGSVPNWVLGNKDLSRIGSQWGAQLIDSFNILLKTLPGVSATYQGEEIGMQNVHISWKETVDPQACQTNPRIYENINRDRVRTPFQWSDEPQAGFTKGNTTWLPLANDYKRVNVKTERGVPQSHLNIYKDLQKLRAENTLRYGETETKALNDYVLGVKRYLAGDRTFVVLLNLIGFVQSIDLNAAFSGLTPELEYVLVTDKSVKHKGDKIKTGPLDLLGNEAVVLGTLD